MATQDSVAVIGGGPVGLAAALECRRAGKEVLLLERFTFGNYSGSSGDLVRMFRLMYTEDYLADLALKADGAWKELEKQARQKLGSNMTQELILRSGLLNFGNPQTGASGPEGTLTGPVKNLERLGLPYRKLTAAEIQAKYAFKDLPSDYIGIFQGDCGCINVPLLVEVLYELCKDAGVDCKQYARVVGLQQSPDGVNVEVKYGSERSPASGEIETIEVSKAVVTCGAYTNDVLASLGLKLNLQIWEMVYAYYAVSPTNEDTFPSMWFQFEENGELFYGFPVVPWGPPHLVRIAVDSATRIIDDPAKRRPGPSEDDLAKTQEFIKRRTVAVNEVPNFAGSCLQTNLPDNNFALGLVPQCPSIAVFCAGWGMKFVPLLGKILCGLVVNGSTTYDIEAFKLDREGVLEIVHPAKRQKGDGIIAGSSLRL